MSNRFFPPQTSTIHITSPFFLTAASRGIFFTVWDTLVEPQVAQIRNVSAPPAGFGRAFQEPYMTALFSAGTHTHTRTQTHTIILTNQNIILPKEVFLNRGQTLWQWGDFEVHIFAQQTFLNTDAGCLQLKGNHTESYPTHSNHTGCDQHPNTGAIVKEDVEDVPT